MISHLRCCMYTISTLMYRTTPATKPVRIKDAAVHILSLLKEKKALPANVYVDPTFEPVSSYTYIHLHTKYIHLPICYLFFIWRVTFFYLFACYYSNCTIAAVLSLCSTSMLSALPYAAAAAMYTTLHYTVYLTTM
jgi:hypothetical protein